MAWRVVASNPPLRVVSRGAVKQRMRTVGAQSTPDKAVKSRGAHQGQGGRSRRKRRAIAGRTKGDQGHEQDQEKKRGKKKKTEGRRDRKEGRVGFGLGLVWVEGGPRSRPSGVEQQQ
ncbi:hypothetical protein BDW42DRAFT_172155 [Aspergillus taichungensis]|uniref:Uncharacterized protein n=1 Tax=Aspergillus taichungensis TaxID=482145 RepID=A0A2J5HRE3_9EURO|nr:hypothetical protein BDW42DRAFT_172155 [Aspergillus taichungensis]